MDIVIEQINSVGKAFVNFAWPMLWQASVLIAILLAADWLLRRKVRAVFRYWLWMLVLAKLFLPTTLSSPVSIGLLTGNALPAINIAATEQPVGGDISSVLPNSPRTAETGETSVALHTETPIQSQAVTPVVLLTREGGIFLVWLMVVCAMLLLLMQRAIFVFGLVRQSAKANGLMNDALKFCCKLMGVRQTIGLKISPNATSPAVCGLFRPVILVPQGLGPSLGIGPLRVVLMHELAHIKRGDLWVNLLQTVLQIAYFYNPLLWVANWVIRRVREQAVDEAVQVALGDRASQYPETLLNVARLAFERPALSLRLTGVVESKSALTSRIKRMLTRPIPKTAKLGIIGSLAIIFFAAVLLPMAKAEKTGEQKTEDGGFVAAVSNGVKVELVGICDYPTEGRKWWRPDGKELAETFNVKEIDTISASGKPYAILIKTTGPDDTAARYDIENSRGFGLLGVVDSQGLNIKGMRGLKVFIDENRSETSVKATFAAGPWTVNIGYNGVGVMSTAKDGYGVTFASPQQTDKGVTLVVSDDFIDCDRQVVAIDDNNEVHKGLNSVGGAGKIHQTTAVFSDITLDKIKGFQIQARPLKRVVFRNVSLKPGVKTDAQALQLISFTITSRKFQNGDSIEITDLSGPAGVIKPGETYIVSGRYTLKSHDDAALHVYATNGEVQSSQGPSIKRGEGRFTRTFTLLKEGDLHLSFYPARGGDSFGGVYFAQRQADAGTAVQNYKVSQTVAEFPEKEDFSTPEAAYATINRVSASGDAAGWQRVSVKELAEKLASENKNGKMDVEPEWAKILLNAKILEVRICDSNIAVVFAKLPQEFTSEPIRKPIDIRHLKLEDGKWLNTGNDRVWTIEESRQLFDNLCKN
jgi:beta-lactamase regulating signal transducer with metallopeptidase domain